MHADSYILKAATPLNRRTSFAFIEMPEYASPGYECAIYALNRAMENVMRDAHRKDLEHSLNGKVVDGFMSDTNEVCDVLDRLNLLRGFEHCRSLTLRCGDEDEPVS